MRHGADACWSSGKLRVSLEQATSELQSHHDGLGPVPVYPITEHRSSGTLENGGGGHALSPTPACKKVKLSL
jgi:hypothetical protein